MQPYLLFGLLYLAVSFNAETTKETTSYIVTLRGRRPKKKVVEIIKSHNNSISFYYNSINAIAGEFDAEVVAALKKHPDVKYVEVDGIVHTAALHNNTFSFSHDGDRNWGLPRISNRQLNLTATYTYPALAGNGVDVWIVDTGIDGTAHEFEGRVKTVASVLGDDGQDKNGHGTHCAGIIGSQSYGVAKGVTLHSVKAFEKLGSASFSDLAKAVQVVIQQARPGKTILSINAYGERYSKTLDDIIGAAFKAGIVVVVPAGNTFSRICNGSPAGLSQVLTVGSISRSDKRSEFSNFGKCVDLYAPGEDIKSLWLRGSKEYNSGTSMASSHVVGVAALFMAEKSYTSPAQVYSDIKNAATRNLIRGIGPRSKNYIVFNQP